MPSAERPAPRGAPGPGRQRRVRQVMARDLWRSSSLAPTVSASPTRGFPTSRDDIGDTESGSPPCTEGRRVRQEPFPG